MPPQTGTALLIFVAFVLPGFATVLLKERMHDAWRDVSPLERLFQVGYYSVWSYLLIALAVLIADVDQKGVTSLYEDHRDSPAILVVLAAGAILIPAFVVANCSRFWESQKVRRCVYGKLGVNARHRVPTAWDAFF